LQVLGYGLIGGVPFLHENQQVSMLYLGNACVGFTAGLLLIPVGTICSMWMPDTERSTCLSLCLNAGNIGTGIGFFLSSVTNQTPYALHAYLNLFPLVPLVVLVLVILFMESEPANPPSHSEQIQRQRAKQEPSLWEQLASPWVEWSRDWTEGRGENGFLISVLSFTSSTVSIYTTATFLPELFTAMGVDASMQPVHGMLFFVLNALGATLLTEPLYTVCSPFVGMVVLQGLLAALHAVIAVVLLLGVQSNFLVVIIFVLAALAALSQAIACDFGCNVAFPVTANVVILWQMVVGQAATAGFNVLFEESKAMSHRPFGASFLMMTAFTVVAMAACVSWRGSYRRTEAAKGATANHARVDDVTRDGDPQLQADASAVGGEELQALVGPVAQALPFYGGCDRPSTAKMVFAQRGVAWPGGGYT